METIPGKFARFSRRRVPPRALKKRRNKTGSIAGSVGCCRRGHVLSREVRIQFDLGEERRKHVVTLISAQKNTIVVKRTVALCREGG